MTARAGRRGVELALPAVNGLLGLSLVFNLTREPALLAPPLAVWIAVGLASGFYPAFVLSSFRASVVSGGSGPAFAAPAWIGKLMVVVQFATLSALLVAAMTIDRQSGFAIDHALGAGRGPILMIGTDCRAGLPRAARELSGVRGAGCVVEGAKSVSGARCARRPARSSGCCSGSSRCRCWSRTRSGRSRSR